MPCLLRRSNSGEWDGGSLHLHPQKNENPERHPLCAYTNATSRTPDARWDDPDIVIFWISLVSAV